MLKNYRFYITLIKIILCILFAVSSVKVIKWHFENKANEKILQKMGEFINANTEGNELEQKYHIDFEALEAENEDTVAFLRVEGTNIESVVVKAKDNQYYLNHNFEKNNNKAGWIFADYRNKFDGTDKNIVIYGHNRRDESMFGTLENILTEEWYSNEENRKIIFVTENEYCIYEVFSVYQIETEDYYIKTEFKDGEFLEYIEKVKSRSIKEFNVEVTEQDNILTLSTCADDTSIRVVLHAKKIK